MIDKEIIYTTGEVKKLLDCFRASVADPVGNSEQMYINTFKAILQNIYKNYRSLSEGYFEVLAKRTTLHIYVDHKKVMQILFHENIDMMPLYINKPILGSIAKLRLLINK